MTEASDVDLENAADSKDSRVLRPVVTRWLKAFRRGKYQPGGAVRAAEVVSLFSSRLPNVSVQGGISQGISQGTSRSISQGASKSLSVDSAARVSELQRQLSEVEVACSELILQCETLERGFDRAQENCDLACARLATVGESVPSADADGLSTLQASYLNFSICLLYTSPSPRDRG